jgi:hypothetical protein
VSADGPCHQDLRHRDLHVVVKDALRYSAEVGEGPLMTFKKRLRRLGRKCDYEAVVRIRKIHRQVVRLALHAADPPPAPGRSPPVLRPSHASAERTSPDRAASPSERDPSQRCSREEDAHLDLCACVYAQECYDESIRVPFE